MNDDPVDVTVVIPTHNVGTYIRECIESVAGQENVNLEIIVVDDHSDDDTIVKVEALSNLDPRISLIRAETRGGGSARNAGAAFARGEYLMFVDGDDIVPDGGVSALLESLRESGSDVACGRYLKFSSTATWDPSRAWPVYKERLRRVTLDEHPALIRGRPCWNRLFRRSYWETERLEFPDVPRSNDIVPMTEALNRATAIDVLPDVVYLYRERPGGGSMTARAARFAGANSYLEQEMRCWSELERGWSPALQSIYFNLLFFADLWVHVLRAVAHREAAAGVPEEREVFAARVGAVIERTPQDVWRALPAERRAVLTLVAQGRVDELVMLDDRGAFSTARGIDDVMLVDFMATVRALQSVEPDLDPFVAVGFRRCVLEPVYESVNFEAGGSTDAVWERWLAQIRQVSEQLLPSTQGQLGTNHRHLAEALIAGNKSRVRTLVRLHSRPDVAISLPVSARRADVINVSIPVEHDVDHARVVLRHRATGEEVLGETRSIRPGHPAQFAVPAARVPFDGLWDLEVELTGPDGSYRTAAVAAVPANVMPVSRFRGVRLDRARQVGHLWVYSKHPTLVRRVWSSVARRLRR